MQKVTATWEYFVFHGPKLCYLIITFDLVQHHSEILDVILQLFVTAVCCCIDPCVILSRLRLYAAKSMTEVYQDR